MRHGLDVHTTPMIRQFLDLKDAHKGFLMFFRVGGYYMLLFDDARIASRALGMWLATRGRHAGRTVPMCAVPLARANECAQKLVALGHFIAICEQIEDTATARKRGPKAIVTREVTRVVLPEKGKAA